MSRNPPEGRWPDREYLLKLYQQFQEYREIEGPKAGDEAELLRLEGEMIGAFEAGDAMRFLDLMATAHLLMDGFEPNRFTDPLG